MESWRVLSHDAPSSNAPTPLDVRPKPPSSLYALPGFLRADSEALKNSKSAFDGLEVADALQKAHGRRFDGAPLMDDDVDAILATYGGSFDESAAFCGKCDRVYDAVTAFRQTFARSRRRRPARSLDVALHACEFVVRTLRDHCRSCLGDALLDARVRTGGAADYEACRVALLRYFAAEDAPSLVVASLGGSLRETVGAPLERALDEAAAACLDEYGTDAAGTTFAALCVGEARARVRRSSRTRGRRRSRAAFGADWETLFPLFSRAHSPWSVNHDLLTPTSAAPPKCCFDDARGSPPTRARRNARAAALAEQQITAIYDFVANT